MNTLENELQTTVQHMATRGKGILAADESLGTIGKRFQTINLENNEENRRAYRELICTTPNLHDYICGIILFEETLGQNASNGTPLPQILLEQNILPGIKVDMGLVPLTNNSDEKSTQGLDGLADRLIQYKKQGAKFAKWRCVYTISSHLPSTLAIETNATSLANYAAICQSVGIVPIVEPELLIDGNHSLERCAQATEMALHEVFNALYKHNVKLEHIVLKPSMVSAGKDHKPQASEKDVAKATVEVLRRTVPAAVPTINFLSGGHNPEISTRYLDEMNKLKLNPWNLSFSYGRALQEHCLNTWKGKEENWEAAQAALYHRAKLNAAASLGEYSSSME